MTQGPIVSNGRGERRGGWNIDRWAAMLALTISVASAVVAMLEGRAMERLVTANSWPFLEYETGNFDDERRLPPDNAGDREQRCRTGAPGESAGVGR